MIIASTWSSLPCDYLFPVIISFYDYFIFIFIRFLHRLIFMIVSSSWSSRPHDSLIVIIISSSWSSYRRDMCILVIITIISSAWSLWWSSHLHRLIIMNISFRLSHCRDHFILIIMSSSWLLLLIILAWSFYLLDHLIFTIISTSWSSHSQAHFLPINSSSILWSSHPRWSSCFHDHRILMIITSSGSLILICNVKRMLTSTFYILFKLILLAKLLILFYVFYACSFPTCRKFLSFFKDITS